MQSAMLRLGILALSLISTFMIESVTRADVLVMNSGREWEGDVSYDEKNATYTIRTDGGTLVFPASMVTGVKKGAIAPARPAVEEERGRNKRQANVSPDSTNASGRDDPMPEGGESISDAEVAETRERTLKELNLAITKAGQQVAKMRHNSPERREVADSIRRMRETVTEVEKGSDNAIRARILRTRAEQAAMEQAARERREAAEREAAIKLEAKFPGWRGPWRICPICNGSGRDAVAEREVNTHNASILGSQMLGSGRTGIVRIPLAVVPCEFCGGCGRVPDYRK